MAISVRATSTGPNSVATSTTISLPAGTTTGDVTFIVFAQANPTATLTQPAGWTVLFNASGTVLCYRVWQSGDPSSVTATSTASAFWESVSIAYTGLDTTTPVDVFSSSAQFNTGTSSFATANNIAPSVCANFNNGQLLCCFAYNFPNGNTLGNPTALTSRVTSGAGPSVRFSDLALTTGAATGQQVSSIGGSRGTSDYLAFGASIILKASGASAATPTTAFPVIGGLFNQAVSASSITPLLDSIGVTNNDMVMLSYSGPGTITGVTAGYTNQSANQGAYCYTHLWQTGDGNPTITFSGTTSGPVTVTLLRKSGSSANNISVDKVSAVTNTSHPVTTTTSTLVPINANELLLILWGSNLGGSWSAVTGGLTNLITLSFAHLDWLEPASNPTGTFSATLTVGGVDFTLSAAAILFNANAGAAPNVASNFFFAA